MWRKALSYDSNAPADFGHWLAGFLDGEGCFSIQHNNGTFQCSLKLGLRLDDLEILEEIQCTLGIGRIYKVSMKSSREKGIHASDQCTWAVYRIRDIIRVLIPLLEKYPLRSKKKRDFELWAEAAKLIFMRMHLRKPGKTKVLELKREMEKGRRNGPLFLIE